jgi:hypothetical protein
MIVHEFDPSSAHQIVGRLRAHRNCGRNREAPQSEKPPIGPLKPGDTLFKTIHRDLDV